MNKMFNTMQKNWKRIVSVFMVLVLVVTSVNMQWNAKEAKAAEGDYYFSNSNGDVIENGGRLKLRRSNDTLTVNGFTGSGYTYQWESTQENYLSIDSTTSRTATIHAKNRVGDVSINVTVFQDGEEVAQLSLTIEVVFSINEFISRGVAGVSMEYLNKEDANKEDGRKVLILDYDTHLTFGESAETDQSKLNLIFGNASAPNVVNWVSSDDTVFEVIYREEKNDDGATDRIPVEIHATGAGVAELSVEYWDGSTTYTDAISVYVKPQVKRNDVVIAEGTTKSTVDIAKTDVKNIKLEITNTTGAINNKLVWVVTKIEDGSGKEVLVNDSLTNKSNADVSLSWLSAENRYRVNAKAGEYEVKFYVRGTYTDFETAQAQELEENQNQRYVSFVLKVPANYEDKEETIGINGSYNLSDAFNIPEDVLRDNFDIILDQDFDGIDSRQYLDINKDGVTIDAKYLGKGRVIIRPKTDVNIPGVNTDNGLPEGRTDLTAYVIINVVEEFSLSQSNLTMVVGEERDLSGVLGSGSNEPADRFTWSISDETYLTFVRTSGENATVRAMMETPVGSPVVVTLTWRDDEGVNHTASCRITIRKAETELTVSPATEYLEAGGISKILQTNLTGQQNLRWISSDTNSVVVDPMDGTTKATIYAPANAKPGPVVITVVNMDNGISANCVVTVTAPITSMAFKQGEVCRRTLADKEEKFEITYLPVNATNAQFIWSSSDERIATVDDRGNVTFLREGDVWITARPIDNPNNVRAECHLFIVEDPIRQIIPKETEVDLIKGDRYEVIYEILPKNPSDPTIQWTSLDTSVATVSQDGIITAVGVGETTITITGGLVGRPPVAGGDDPIPAATIKVRVRERLKTISFNKRVVYVPLNGTEDLEVSFEPDEGVDKTLVWSSTDDSIVTVSDNGNQDGIGTLRGVAIGTAMVTCYAEDLGPENMISCMVYVTDQTIIPAESLAIFPEEAELEVGHTLQMDAVFNPEDTTNKDIQWTSSDTNIATVTPDGLVSALEVGEVMITALYTDTPDGLPWIYTSKITVIPATVEATGFDVTPDSMNIKVKERFTITPVFTPENTTDKSVEYQTTDENVAIVSETGVVTGVGAGDCIIQCQAISGGFVATVAVHVENAIGFSLSPSYREIAVGKSFTISKVTVPANADKTAVWTSSNTNIATVSSSGKVTAKKIGTCTITCTLTEYNQSATCRVKVAKLNSTVSLNKKNIRIGVGNTYRLKATVWSNNSTTPTVKWKSANKKIASVSSKGKVKGKRVGATKITVTTKDKVKAKATCKVTVIRRATSVKISKRYAICYVGRTMKLKASVKPKTATIKKIKWTSSNKNIAVVSGGRVTGMSEGDVTITAQATDGSGKKASCLVKVMEEVPASSVVVAQTNLTMKKGDSTKLTYSVLPKNNSDHISFASDNKRVAKVSSNGKVKAVGTGTANITILAGSGITTTVVINVVDLNKYSVKMRQYDTETLRVFGTNDNITWYSSNNSVATVEGGVVTGRSIGSAYIYAYVNGCKLACRVTITSVNK